MKVREIMGSHVRQISSSAMLSEAADRMRALGVCALPVVENNQVAGVVTEHDIAMRAACEGVNPGTTPIQEVMTTDVACCSEQDDVEQAARIMEESRVRWLVVLGPDHAAIGILSIEGLAPQAGQERLAGEVPETICKPAQGTTRTARRI